jgi:chromosome segregation ATPase
LTSSKNPSRSVSNRFRFALLLSILIALLFAYLATNIVYLSETYGFLAKDEVKLRAEISSKQIELKALNDKIDIAKAEYLRRESEATRAKSDASIEKTQVQIRSAELAAVEQKLESVNANLSAAKTQANKLENVRALLAEAGAKKTQAEVEFEDISKKLKQLKSSYLVKNSEYQTALSNTRQQESKLAKTSEDVAIATAQYDAIGNKTEAANRELKSLEVAVNVKQNERARIGDELVTARSDRDATKMELQEKSAELAAAVAAFSGLNFQSSTLSETIASAQAELAKLKEEIDVKQTERARIGDELVTARSDRDATKMELQEKSAELAAAVAAFSGLNFQSSTLSETIASAQAELTKLKEEIDVKQTERDALIADITAKTNELRVQHESLSDAKLTKNPELTTEKE